MTFGADRVMDEVFMNANPDPNYIARRQNSIIIASIVCIPSAKLFLTLQWGRT